MLYLEHITSIHYSTRLTSLKASNNLVEDSWSCKHVLSSLHSILLKQLGKTKKCPSVTLCGSTSMRCCNSQHYLYTNTCTFYLKQQKLYKTNSVHQCEDTRQSSQSCQCSKTDHSFWHIGAFLLLLIPKQESRPVIKTASTGAVICKRHFWSLLERHASWRPKQMYSKE